MKTPQPSEPRTFCKRAQRLFEKITKNRKLRVFFSTIANIVAVLFASTLIFYLFVFFAPTVQEIFVRRSAQPENNPTLRSEKFYSAAIQKSEKELDMLRRKYNALTPKQNYLVINTTENHFFLYRDQELIREGFISSGSYIKLQAQDEREWIFKTPKGRRTIQGKITSPVWRRPDWAFIEEGLPVPSGDHPSRYERGVLGDYAMSLGDGYLIHGTLYKRFLGMPVTHGCIRLNDEDLEFIFNSLNIGSKVYIY